MLNAKLVFEIRRQVRSFADGDISLSEFRSWFVTADQRAQFGVPSGTADPEAVTLTDAITSVLSDFDDGLIASGDLRQVLRLIQAVPHGAAQLASRDSLRSVIHFYARPTSTLALSREFVPA